MHLLYVVIRMVSMVTDFYVLYHAKNLNILDDPEDKDAQAKEEKRVDDIPLSNMHWWFRHHI